MVLVLSQQSVSTSNSFAFESNLDGEGQRRVESERLRREEEDGTSLLVLLAETMNDVGMSGQLPRAGGWGGPRFSRRG